MTFRGLLQSPAPPPSLSALLSRYNDDVERAVSDSLRRVRDYYRAQAEPRE